MLRLTEKSATEEVKQRQNLRGKINIVRLVAESDLPEWLNLVREVEALFGPVVDDPDFLPAVNEAIRSNLVFGYENEETHKIEGVLIISHDVNSIEWLAVSEKARNGGIGSKLLEKALAELDTEKDITVQTFAAEIEAGTAARKLYQKYGFVDLESAGKNPAGINIFVMIRRCS